jgi:hypothetical protein
LRLLIVVGGHGAVVAAFRNRADRWWHFCRNGVATGVTPLPVQWAGERVGDEATDGLRLLLVVGAQCAFVAVLRNHAEIVLTHPNRETP